MISRRSLLGAPALLAGCSAPPPARTRASSPFVGVEAGRLTLRGAPYRYAGANLWYGAYLGADTPYGDRARLVRELDRLQAIGVDNLRVLGASELSPLRGSLKRAFNSRRAPYNEELLGGLDFLLAEMGRRDMRAVIYLNNFWEWSGGMATYLYWTNGGRYIDMNDPAHPWPEFPDFSAQFYASEPAVALSREYLHTVVTRTNTITRTAYRDDPTIMAWQLANEPRPAGSPDFGRANMAAYQSWIRATARLVKSLDANHLVSTGSEGLKGCVESSACVIDAHADPSIDYMTAHIWPQNWSWVNPVDLERTFANAETNTRAYIDDHVDFARRLGKPLVIEEFGFPRDGASFDPEASVTLRDRFYGLIYRKVEEDVSGGGPLAGTNFWAWGGEGRALHPDRRMRDEDTSYLGDPPHEPQGWYSVFDTDQSTVGLISAHARAIRARRA